jgi:MobC-like protein
MKSRNLKVSIRVSADEQSEIMAIAHRTSMSVSNYGRKKMLGEPINQVIVPPINIDTYRALVDLKDEVRAIGQNLNQITRWMHSHQANPPLMVATIETTQHQIELANQILRQIQLASIGADR